MRAQLSAELLLLLAAAIAFITLFVTLIGDLNTESKIKLGDLGKRIAKNNLCAVSGVFSLKLGNAVFGMDGNGSFGGKCAEGRNFKVET